MKFTIVTVTYNCKALINDTLRSIQSQTFKNFEHIIIDGCSSDGTLRILESYREQYKNICLVSEKDKGIYDAMNKAVKYANGEWIYFLNAGDVFASNLVLEKIALEEQNKFNIIYGNTICMNQSENKIIKQQKINKLFFIRKKTVCHQALFVDKELFEKIGMFNIDYSLLADRDWLIRALLLGENFKYIDLDVVLYDTNGVSANPYNLEKAIEEYEKIFFQHFNPLIFLMLKVRHRIGRLKRIILNKVGNL